MAFGIEIYGPNGNTLLSMSSRVSRFGQSGTFTLNAGASANITVAGMQDNDSWDVFLSANTLVFLTYKKFTGYFIANNPAGGANCSCDYVVVRS